MPTYLVRLNRIAIRFPLLFAQNELRGTCARGDRAVNSAAPGAAAPGFNDVVQGNNGAYKAAPGWDACTGLGSPNGAALLDLLSGTTPTTGS